MPVPSGTVTKRADPSTVPPHRLARLARAANVSRWFRYPPPGADVVERHLLEHLREDDLALIRSAGLTAVRLTVAFDEIVDAAGDATDPRRLGLLDRAVARLTGAGLAVVVVVHDAGEMLESGDGPLAAFLRFWTAFGAHLATTDPESVLLEPINEPMFTRTPWQWPPVERRLLAAVRAVAPLHTLVTGGPNWSGIDGLLTTHPVDDPNVIYTFHFYEPFLFTHQGAPWLPGQPVSRLHGVPYPSSPEAVRRVTGDADADAPARRELKAYGDALWGPDRLRARVGAAAAWAVRYGVPLWCGEFGGYQTVAPREDWLRWLRDTRVALDEHGIGWAVWSYDESLGLDRRVDAAGRVTIDREAALALGLAPPPPPSNPPRPDS